MSERHSDHPLHHLLPYYDWGTISETERAILESHALECDACFVEMERGITAAQVLRDHRKDAIRILNAQSRLGKRVWFSGGLSWKRPWLLAPAGAALLVVLTWILLSSRSDYRDLASFPLEPESNSIVRGPTTSDAVGELIQIGLARLDLEQYGSAEQAFASALERDPRSARAAYLLGITRARAGRVESAIHPLDTALKLASPELSPHAQWALANAHLAAGHLQKAKDILMVLAAGSGDLADKARTLLSRLPSGP